MGEPKWLEYEVRGGETSFEATDARLGYSAGCGKTWKEIWDHSKNEAIRKVRSDPNQLQAGDKVWLLRAFYAPPPARPGEEWGEYRCSPQVQSLYYMTQQILAKYGPSSPSYVLLDTLDPKRGAYWLEQNEDFRDEHRLDGTGHILGHIMPGAKLFVRVRRKDPPVTQPVSPAAPRATAPATGSGTPSNTHTETRKYATAKMRAGVFVPFVASKPGTNRITLDVAITAPLSKIQFKVVHYPNGVETVLFSGPIDPAPYLNSTEGKPDAVWEWDGYDEHGVLNTRILRGVFSILVVAHPADGNAPSYSAVPFDHGAVYAKYIDVRVDRQAAEKRIDATLYYNCSTLSDDDIKDLVGSTPTAKPRFGSIPDALAALGAAARLTEAEVREVKAHIEEGIANYWQRRRTVVSDPAVLATPPCVTLGGEQYDFVGTAEARAEGNAGLSVSFRALRPIDLLVAKFERPCNLGVVVAGQKIYLPYPTSDVLWFRKGCAHEYGHSILQDGLGRFWSLTHKGSTDVMQVTLPKPKGQSYPAAPDEMDLMKYYHPPLFSDYQIRMMVAADDAKLLVGLAGVAFQPR